MSYQTLLWMIVWLWSCLWEVSELHKLQDNTFQKIYYGVCRIVSFVSASERCQAIGILTPRLAGVSDQNIFASILMRKWSKMRCTKRLVTKIKTNKPLSQTNLFEVDNQTLKFAWLSLQTFSDLKQTSNTKKAGSFDQVHHMFGDYGQIGKSKKPKLTKPKKH